MAARLERGLQLRLPAPMAFAAHVGGYISGRWNARSVRCLAARWHAGGV